MPDLVVVQADRINADTSRGTSGSVWKGCPWLEIGSPLGRSGVKDGDDFLYMDHAGANADTGKYKVVGTTGTAALVSSSDGGLVQLKPGALANNEAYLVLGQALASMGQILKNTSNRLWFECRVKLENIVDGGYFFGLAKPADVASGFLVNTTTVVASTANAVGFNVANGTPSKIDIVYAKGAAPTTYKAAAQTALTTKFYKLGIYFDGQNKVRFFVDGKEIADTNGALGVAADATNFPSSIQLTPVFAAKNVTGTANTCLVDWWYAALVIEDATQGQA